MLTKQELESLKEIQSVDQQLRDLIKLKEVELSRITKISSTIDCRIRAKEEKISELSAIKKMIQDHSNSLDSLYKREEALKSQSNSATSEKERTAFEVQLQTIDEKKSVEEDAFFKLSEKSEQLEIEIKEDTVFIEGAIKSKGEIEQIVNESNIDSDRKIEVTSERVKYLFSELSDEVRQFFSPIYAKYRFNSPLAFDDEGKCSKCRFVLDQITRTELRKNGQLQQCDNCSRLLIPR